MTAALVETTASLPAETIEAAMRLVDEAAAVDGFPALNEAASLRLRHHHAGTVHLLVRSAGRVVGYGQLQLALRQAQGADEDQAQGADEDRAQGAGGDQTRDANGVTEGAVVVHPQHRRQGLGTTLLHAMVAESHGRLQIWAVRNTGAARALAERVGLAPVRQLLIMKRSLDEAPPQAEVPAGVRIRPFRPGHDEEAWLAVNSRAFADHPEQGGLTRADLDERMREPWFDAAGFLVADALRQAQGAQGEAQGAQGEAQGAQGEAQGAQGQAQGAQADTQGARMLGFHWTKQHPGRLGEVYVLGVDPDAGVRGLGRALLTTGLAHLRGTGNTEVQLYADADNLRAVELYTRAGFEVDSSDVMYAGPDGAASSVTTMHSSSDA